jgi:isochorismate synthase EntC
VGWNSFCEKISAALAAGKLKKAVPARGRRYTIEERDRRALIETIFANLFSAPDPRTFRFLIREHDDIFFGATPELLFRRENGKLFVPAIAGTRALADLGEAEAARELMASRKEREEHAFVVEGILASLRELGFEPTAPDEPDVLRVPGLLHLFTPIKAKDIPSLSGEKILRALHPTPAVGGLPKTAGQEFLLRQEPWDRGLFAAPIFFRLPGREICLVAIRSALLRQGSLHFFAGAGFVAGSNAQAEWKETERKMDVMQSLLTGKTL